MNRIGQMGLGLLSFIGVVIVGLVFVNFLMPEVSTFRVDLQCSNAAGISDGTKLLCLVGDAVIPYVIILIFALGVGAITSKLNL
jgi:hypothetical protein